MIRCLASNERFSGRLLTGEEVVLELFERWELLQDHEPDGQDVFTTLGRLPDALKARYCSGPVDKQQRYYATLPLVKALDSPYAYLRAGAIACLRVVYRKTLFYKVDMKEAERLRIQRRWQKELERLVR